MELVNILKILRRWSWLIISIVLVAAIGLTLWSSSAELVYEAQVRLQMSAPQQEDVAAYDQYRAINLRDEITVARNNFIEVVQDYEIHDHMVQQHNLDEYDAEYDLEVVSERDTDFINVIVRARNPQLAALIANTLVDEAITYSGELRAKPTNAEKNLYSDQLDAAMEEFRAEEDAFIEFKTQNGIASLEGEIAISQTLLKQLKLARDQRVLDNEPYQNDLISQIDKMIAQHREELDRLSALQPMYSILEENAQQAREEYMQTMSGSESANKMVTAEEEYRVAEDAFTEFKSQNNITSLQAEIEITQRLFEQLRLERDKRILEEPTLMPIVTLIAQRQMELDRLVMLQPTYNLLEENAQEARAKYQHILSKFSEAELKAAMVQAANFIQIVHPAQAPLEPANNPTIFIVLGLVGSLGFGVLLAFFLDYIMGASGDTRIIDEIDARSVLGFQILGIVPTMNNSLFQQNTPEAEAIRQLRTRILLSSPDTPLKTILITSPQSGDGKTAISANLGSVLAESRSAVVVIDADLRNPNLHEIFDKPNLDGLADLLEADKSLLDLLVLQRQQLRETRVPRLSFLSAGTLPQDPSLLLTSPNIPILIEDLSHQFDFVLIDSPPLLTAPDATILAKSVDGIIIVLDPKTSSRVVREAIDSFGSRGDLPILGVVLNRTSPDLYAYGYFQYQDTRTSLLDRPSSLLKKLRKTPDPNLISESRASIILGVRESTIKRWRQEGRLPVVKRGWRWWVREDELKDQFGVKVQKDQGTSPPSIAPSESVAQQQPQQEIESTETHPVPVEAPPWKLQVFAAQALRKVEEYINKVQYRFSDNHQPDGLDAEVPEASTLETETVAPSSIEVTGETDLSMMAEPMSIGETLLEEEPEPHDEEINSVESPSKVPALETENEADMVSVNQAAKMLGVHTNTVRLWCREGRIHGVKRNRRWLISKESVRNRGV